MATYQWTGKAGTGVFTTAANWQTLGGGAATQPPGAGDTAIVMNAGQPISGTGSAEVLNFGGENKVAGHLTASFGAPVNEDLTLLSDAILATPMLHISVNFGPNPPITHTAAVRVGANSRVVISGSNPPDTYAIQLANIGNTPSSAGWQATLSVEGAQAVVDGGDLPMSVGQSATGVLKVADGARVSVGNGDPLIYPWALVIGNHAGSAGLVEVTSASLMAHGQIIVGRKSTGTLEINEGGLVTADDMAIGWAPGGGQGSVTVKGPGARLLVDNLLEVQHMGVGTLTLAQAGFVSAGIGVLVNGAMVLADGYVETTALGVNLGGTLSGYGTLCAAAGFVNNGGAITAEQQLSLIGDIDNAGTMTAAGGELRCFGSIDDTGAIILQAGGAASLEAVTSGQTITFAGSNARLLLQSPGAFQGVIKGFSTTHVIEVAANVTTLSFAGSALTLNDGTGNPIAELQLQGSYGLGSFHLTPGFPSVIKFV